MQIVEPLAVQSAPLPLLPRPSWPIHLPQHPIVEHPQPTFLPLCERPRLIEVRNNNIYLQQLGCYPVAVVILHVNKT